MIKRQSAQVPALLGDASIDSDCQSVPHPHSGVSCCIGCLQTVEDEQELSEAQDRLPELVLEGFMSAVQGGSGGGVDKLDRSLDLEQWAEDIVAEFLDTVCSLEPGSDGTLCIAARDVVDADDTSDVGSDLRNLGMVLAWHVLRNPVRAACRCIFTSAQYAWLKHMSGARVLARDPRLLAASYDNRCIQRLRRQATTEPPKLWLHAGILQNQVAWATYKFSHGKAGTVEFSEEVRLQRHLTHTALMLPTKRVGMMLHAE